MRAQPQRRAWTLFHRPAWIWSGAAVAAVLLIGVLAYRNFKPGHPQQAAVSEQKGAPQSVSEAGKAGAAAASQYSRLADLTLPAYVELNLRGENTDSSFEAGMKKYAQGDCRGAIADLALVAVDSAEARSARLYMGSCQMRLGNWKQAAGILHEVADAGDSPQQETALFELAQVALASGDPATAKTYLERTIALRGDFERRARAQQRQLAEISAQSQPIPGDNTGTK
jgi:hypothetical protein